MLNIGNRNKRGGGQCGLISVGVPTGGGRFEKAKYESLGIENHGCDRISSSGESETRGKQLAIPQRLKGSHFRRINEYLYTNKSDSAYKEYLEDENMFEQYHSGYDIQKSQWPLDPLEKVIDYISKNGRLRTIGDFGCGRAKIGQLFGGKKGYKVYSFDLNCPKDFAYKNNITICNIKSVPLNDNTLDLAVFCLSLMGTDWPLFIAEAYRVVKHNGLIMITEVTSRFESVERFVSSIERFNLKLVGSPTDITNYFTQFIFVKKGTSAANRLGNTGGKARANNQFLCAPKKDLLGKEAVTHCKSAKPNFPFISVTNKRFFSHKLNRILIFNELHKQKSVSESHKTDSNNNHSETILIASSINPSILKPCIYKKR